MNDLMKLIPHTKAGECIKNDFGVYACWCVECSGRWNPKKFENSNFYQKLYKLYGKPIGLGASRLVFKFSDEYVLKYGYNNDGIEHNKKEAKMSEKFSSLGVPVAKSFLEEIDDTEILFQEMVNPIIPTNHNALSLYLPEWTDRLFDGYQIGFNKEGKLVCFDFGHEVM